MTGGGGCYLVEPRILYGMHISELLFFPCVSLAASDTAATLGGCASVPKCLHVVTDS